MASVGDRAAEDQQESQGHSGRLLLRMPRTLHAELSRAAEGAGVSLNQLIVGTLARSLEGEGAAEGEERPPDSAPEPRLLGLALVLNLVVLVAAGGIAVALLIAALNGGF